jgi:hypothetical protein
LSLNPTPRAAAAPQMRFRGLISTSNLLEGPEVDVTADEELLWITEFAEDSRGGHSFSWGSDGNCLGGRDGSGASSGDDAGA